MNRIISAIIVFLFISNSYFAQLTTESQKELTKDSSLTSVKDKDIKIDNPDIQMPKWHEFITNIPSGLFKILFIDFQRG